jgi:hypothetical protein
MAIRKLMTWRGSEGIGASPAPDSVLFDFWSAGYGGSMPIDNATMDIGTASSFTMRNGSAGVTDELETINGGTSGAFIVLRNVDDITVKDGVGNIKLAGGDFYMDDSSTECTLILLFDGTDWLEVSRGTDII